MYLPVTLFDSPLLVTLRQVLPPDRPVYLVGGALRDAFLGRHTKDLDFTLSGEVLPLARRLADKIGAAYFPLDVERQTARLVLVDESGSRQFIDFAAFRGEDLSTDLAWRDFTANALAVEIHHLDELIDPLNGLEDIRLKKLRAASPQAFQTDPLRVLRGVRLAASLGFQIERQTLGWMKEAAGKLSQVSTERVRDELMHMLGGPKPEFCVRALDRLGVLPVVYPELEALKGVTQSQPHVADVWEHTLAVVGWQANVLDALGPTPPHDKTANLALGLAVMKLARFHPQIDAHLNTRLNPDRSMRSLLLFAALYHDAGKPGTRAVEASGRIRFLGHEDIGRVMIMERARSLHLSNLEVDRLGAIIGSHLRPMLLAQTTSGPSRKAVYRFFHDTGPAGIDVCLLSLADYLGTVGSALQPEGWERHLDVVNRLMEAWWQKKEEIVSPQPLVDGYDLRKALRMDAGPEVGRLLEAIREAQADGKVTTREDALSFARRLLQK